MSGLFNPSKNSLILDFVRRDRDQKHYITRLINKTEQHANKAEKIKQGYNP